MSWIGRQFADGRAIDAVLALAAIEAAALLAYHRATGRGVAAAALLPNLLAGLCLLAALRFALAGAGWVWIAACLTGSLIAHVADLRTRWRT